MAEAYVVGAVNGSEGRLALDAGVRLAQRDARRLVVVHVEHVPSMALVGETFVSAESAVFDALERTEEEVEQEVRQHLSTSAIEWSFEVAHGEPADELVRVAIANDAAAIIVAGEPHGVVAGLLLGSTAEKLVRHSPVSVIVVRAPRATAA